MITQMSDRGADRSFAHLIGYFHVYHLSGQVAFDVLKKEYRDWIAHRRSDALLAAKAEHMWMEVGSWRGGNAGGLPKRAHVVDILRFSGSMVAIYLVRRGL